MTDTAKFCRLCLKEIDDNGFQNIEQTVCNILSVLNLKINLEISKEPIMCISCGKNLEEFFNFKTKCTEIKETMQPFINGQEDTKISLPQIYLKINENRSLNHEYVCRFCMCETSSEFSTSLKKMVEVLPGLRNFLKEYFPDVDLNLVRNPVVCKICENLLKKYLAFAKKCVAVEEGILTCIESAKDSKDKVELEDVKPLLDTVEIKEEIVNTNCINYQVDSKHSEVIKDDLSFLNVKSEGCMKTEELRLNIDLKPIEDDSKRFDGATFLQKQPKITTIDTIKSEKLTVHKCEECGFHTKNKRSLKNHMLTHKSTSEVTMHQCTLCAFHTKRKSSLQQHMITHKKTSEVTTYKCKICDHHTKYKNNLQQHMLTHKSTSEVTIHKCPLCDYQSKYKTGLRYHMLTHKSTSEVTMHKCEICEYHTKYKTNLETHMLTHKSTSEVTMHKCELCEFRSKYKPSLQKHMFIHKSTSEVTIHKCEFCEYCTKYKNYLQRHMLTHKSTSEVEMHKCTLCGFCTKRKNSLPGHMLIHKSASDVTMYKCTLCEFHTKHKNSLRRHMLNH